MQTITYLLIISIGLFTNLLSFNLRVKVGEIIGNILILLSNKRKIITFNNIRNAFPEKSDTEVNLILKKSYQNLGITLVELLYLKKLSDEELNEIIKFENLNIVKEKLELGKGVLFLSGHYGNWEYLAYSAGVIFNKEFNKNINIVVKTQKNKKLNEVLNKYRCKSGNSVVPLKKAAFEIIKILKNNGLVALLTDQKAAKKRDIYIDFFGRPALTYIAPAKLAIKFNTPIIVGFAERQENNRYKVVLEELNYDDILGKDNAIDLLTIKHSKILEEQIRKNPYQWSWQHNRWK